MNLGEDLKLDRRQPTVSIILPTYNDGDCIERCLNSLIDMRYDKKEIIVVDDGSIDQTKDVLQKYKKNGHITAIHTSHKGRSHARNTGMEMSSGEILFFAEADGVYHPDYITKTIEHFKNPSVGGVLASGRVLNPCSIVQKCINVEFEIREFKMKEGSLSPISAWVFRTWLFKQLGGYDENLEVAEDQDIAIRVREMGYQIAYHPEVLWWHPAPNSLIEFMINAYYHGRERIPFVKKHPEKKPIKQLFLLASLTIIITISTFYQEFIPIFLVLGVITYFSMLGRIVRLRRNINGKRYLLILPILSVIRATSLAVGYLMGLINNTVLKPRYRFP